jgi:predicted nucleotidyltransferase
MIELSDLLGSKASLQLLELFIQRPDQPMYQAEIINDVKASTNPQFNWNTAKKWLNNFVSYGLVSERKKGKWILYTLDRTNPVVKEYKIFTSVAKLYEVIRTFQIKQDLQGPDAEIYLFGSAARGEDNEDSDIDLLIIGQIDDNTLVELKESVKDKMKKDVNIIAYPRAGYSDLYRSDKAFFDNIEKDKTKLL